MTKLSREDRELIDALIHERTRLHDRATALRQELAEVKRDLRGLTLTAIAEKFDLEDPRMVLWQSTGEWTRTCLGCGADISHRNRKAQTCSDRCRKRIQLWDNA